MGRLFKGWRSLQALCLLYFIMMPSSMAYIVYHHNDKPAFEIYTWQQYELVLSRYLGLFPSYYPTGGEKVFVFDPKLLAFAIYLPEGVLFGAGKAVGGASWCADAGRPCKTVLGEHQVIRKGSQYCSSGKYTLPNGGAPMPYCMHFHPRGYAIHGSNELPGLNASHGCIRVEPQTAEWLSNNFMDVGTKVIVLDY